MKKYVFIVQDKHGTIKGVFAYKLKAQRYVHLARIKGEKFTCERWEVYHG